MQMTAGDLLRLEPKTYLNDNLIGLFLNFIVREGKVMPLLAGSQVVSTATTPTFEDVLEGKMQQVHMFNSFFYDTLTGGGESKGRIWKMTKDVDSRSASRWSPSSWGCTGAWP